jgi:hypothetical protein
MAKADPNSITNTPIATQVADGLADLESLCLRVRGLTRAAGMAASSMEMSQDATDAIDALTETILEEIDELLEERTRIWRLARNGRRWPRIASHDELRLHPQNHRQNLLLPIATVWEMSQ